MRLMHSGRDFVRLYERQDQLAFLDGHVRAFAHFGGVPRRTVYDNLAAAVRRVQFPRRALTERFAALASHYGVEPCFARPGEGHDKGGVESRGRGVRLQVLTPIPRGDSMHELSEQMQEEVDRLAPQRVWERFASEQPALRPHRQRLLPPAGHHVREGRCPDELFTTTGGWGQTDHHGWGQNGLSFPLVASIEWVLPVAGT